MMIVGGTINERLIGPPLIWGGASSAETPPSFASFLMSRAMTDIYSFSIRTFTSMAGFGI